MKNEADKSRRAFSSYNCINLRYHSGHNKDDMNHISKDLI